MKAKGTIKRIFETQTIGAKEFKKREFVLTIAENPDYPQDVKFELIQDKCGLLDDCSIGQELEVEFNLNGREWTNQKGEQVYFNTLQVWRIEKGASVQSEPEQMPSVAESDDDLPF